ncbi:MAG: hypothetical protein EZS28_026544 [Streblomastix strix]|uniref:Uncharacterized protein n=1 Tax=Streblomastix strix TaxID=222440 RepID=A0A5J4V6H0_9EUKA|nr:MAG: hypothetical protein EZS28_026544 [Streblomastix strix]
MLFLPPRESFYYIDLNVLQLCSKLFIIYSSFIEQSRLLPSDEEEEYAGSGLFYTQGCHRDRDREETLLSELSARKSRFDRRIQLRELRRIQEESEVNRLEEERLQIRIIRNRFEMLRRQRRKRLALELEYWTLADYLLDEIGDICILFSEKEIEAEVEYEIKKIQEIFNFDSSNSENESTSRNSSKKNGAEVEKEKKGKRKMI